jgi:hypothetical protein
MQRTRHTGNCMHKLNLTAGVTAGQLLCLLSTEGQQQLQQLLHQVLSQRVTLQHPPVVWFHQ